MVPIIATVVALIAKVAAAAIVAVTVAALVGTELSILSGVGRPETGPPSRWLMSQIEYGFVSR